MNTIDQIREQLAALEPLVIDIADDSALHAGHAGARSGGGHYRMTIVSSQFTGKATMARHRLVYHALGTLMKHEIHALSITAKTPEEFDHSL
jgi:BolA protein